MPDYQLHFLNSDNVIINRHAHAYLDDLGALDRARELANEYAIEIWQNKRRVALVKIGDAPLNAGDRGPL